MLRAKPMTTIIIAAISGTIGCVIGLAIAACCHAAGREDEAAERTLWPEDKQRSGLLEEDE